MSAPGRHLRACLCTQYTTLLGTQNTLHCGHERWNGTFGVALLPTFAGVVELVYTCDSKSHGASLEGSSPSSGTVKSTRPYSLRVCAGTVLSEQVKYVKGTQLAKLIVALDSMDASSALEYTKRFSHEFGTHPQFWGVKVHEAIVGAAAWQIMLISKAAPLFIDTKIADTPPVSVSLALRYAALGARYLTIWHTEDEGRVRAVVQALKGSSTEVLAVLALSSRSARPETVRELALAALYEGAQGVIFPPHALLHLRQRLHTDRAIVVPGIRLPGDEQGPHVEPIPPRVAQKKGATHIVVGTTILQSADPIRTTRSILTELESKE